MNHDHAKSPAVRCRRISELGMQHMSRDVGCKSAISSNFGLDGVWCDGWWLVSIGREMQLYYTYFTYYDLDVFVH
jgi:hypothetical protein